MMNYDKLKILFNKLVSNIDTDKVHKLSNYLLSTDFIKCPASTRYHHSYEGGLLEHSIEVYKFIKEVNSLYPEVELTDEVRFILAFGHDISKTNFYTIQVQNKKIMGEWKSVECYGVDDKIKLPHEISSIHILKNIIDIDLDIEKAILYHHGAFNQSTMDLFSESCINDKYTFILHTADMLSANRNSRYTMKDLIESRGW